MVSIAPIEDSGGNYVRTTFKYFHFKTQNFPVFIFLKSSLTRGNGGPLRQLCLEMIQCPIFSVFSSKMNTKYLRYSDLVVKHNFYGY